MKYFKRYWKILVVITIVLILFIFFSYKITEVPPGINGDEASIGYNAILIGNSLRDENRRLLPVFILTLDGKDWKQPVNIYTTAILFKIFGPSFELLRQISVVIILISTILLFILVKKILGVLAAIISSLIFLLSPAVMIQSHLALENITLIPFVLLWLLMLKLFQEKNQTKYLVLSGIFLGISIYSYFGMRLIAPVLGILTIGYLFLNYKSKKKLLMFFLVGFLPFIIFLFLIKDKYAGAIYGSAKPVNISSYQDFFLPYISSFDLSFLFIKGDSTPYHSTGKHGVMLLASLPFFLWGIIQILKRKDPILILILLAFLLSPILFGIVGSVHRGSRLLVFLPLYSIITSLGIIWFYQIKNQIIKYTSLVLIIFIFSFSYLDFLGDYFFQYPQRIKESFPSNAHLGFKQLNEDSKRNNLNPIIEDGVYLREGVAAKFFELTYFDKSLSQWKAAEAFPENSLLLATSQLDTLKEAGIKESKILNTNYSLYSK